MEKPQINHARAKSETKVSLQSHSRGRIQREILTGLKRKGVACTLQKMQLTIVKYEN